MDEPSENDVILEFFKALSDVDRLKIIGALALGSHSLNQISSHLKIKPASVLRHLEYLSNLSLVKQEGQEYQLDTNALEKMAMEQLSNLRPRSSPNDFEGESNERKILSDFIKPDESLKSIPAQEKKLLVVLRYIAQSFQPGQHYSEKEVNVILGGFYDDISSLRRYLVDYKFLSRKVGGGDYWRTET
jgi:hypothetical protein